MPPGEIHRDLAKRPWERTGVYRVPETRLGRPDLPGIETEIEGVGRLIMTLPKLNPWWPGQNNTLEVAMEVRLLLEPRIATITLGRGDAFAEYWMLGPGPADLRCATLCLPHPTEEAWAVESDRRWLFAGEMARRRLFRSVMRSVRQALQHDVARHWMFSPELQGSV
jgi:hypothetical protein